MKLHMMLRLGAGDMGNVLSMTQCITGLKVKLTQSVFHKYFFPVFQCVWCFTDTECSSDDLSLCLKDSSKYFRIV